MKKRLYTVFVWLITIGAYSFLGYKLITFDDYDLLLHELTGKGYSHWIWLLLVLALLPLNIFLESVKWRELIVPVYRVTYRQSIKMVLWGNTGGFITPNRLGEFPSRVLLLPEGGRLSAIALGFIGSAAQMIVICAVGCVTTSILLSFTDLSMTHRQQQFLLISAIVVVVLLLAVYLLLPRFAPLIRRSSKDHATQLADALSTFSFRKSLTVIALAFLRYLTFCIQNAFMYQFCLVDLSAYEALVAIPTIYLLVTLTPSINVSEAAVRSSYAAIVMTMFTTNAAGVIIASTLTWFINCCIPVIAGTLMHKRHTNNE